MDLREISDAVYAGKSVEKKQAIDLVYYEMADFLKDNFPEKYRDYVKKAEQVAYQIEPEEAVRIVQGMIPYGQRWSREDIAEYLRGKGINDHVTEYYLVMNMMVNDYSRTAKIIGQDDADFYFNLAYDFINDEDAKPDKIAKYFMY